MSTPPNFHIELVNKKMLSAEVFELTWQRVDQQPLDFQAGQFIRFYLPYQDEKIRRSYSLSSVPNLNSLHFSTAIAPVTSGRATNILFNMPIKQQIEAAGPLGKLILPETTAQQRLIMLATGTGVSPFRSQLPEIIRLLEQKKLDAAYLIFGARRQADILYQLEFAEAAAHTANFYYITYLSQQQQGPWQPQQYPGRLQQWLHTQKLSPEKDIICLCGNPMMVDEACKYLSSPEIGFSAQQLHREKYTLSPPPLSSK